MQRTLLPILAAFTGLALNAQVAAYRNPVISGNHPEPAAILAGEEYWAAFASFDWLPAFPLYRSLDLVNWRAESAAFPTPPDWASGGFSSPSLSQYRGRFFLYYSALKANGPRCIAVAIAAQPRGPYADQGPILCPPEGATDPATASDDTGRHVLLWRQGPAVRAQMLSPDGLSLTGDVTGLLAEGAAPFILRHGAWFYLLSAAGDEACRSGIALARSGSLLGLYEAHAEPLLESSLNWRCPGHPTVVAGPQGREFLVYDAYPGRERAGLGREVLLEELFWSGDGWPQKLTPGSRERPSPLGKVQKNSERQVQDDFTTRALRPDWQWPLREPSPARIVHSDDILVLRANGRTELPGSVLTRGIVSTDFTAEIIALPPSDPSLVSGLACYTDAANATGIAWRQGQVFVWRKVAGSVETLARASLRKPDRLHLRIHKTGPNLYVMAYSVDGERYHVLKPNHAEGVEWKLPVRIALSAAGAETAAASFNYFEMTSK